MVLNEVDLFFLLRANCVDLQHLDKALRCLLYNVDFVLLGIKELDADLEVVEDLINIWPELSFSALHIIINYVRSS